MIVQRTLTGCSLRAVEAGAVPGVVALAADDQGVRYRGPFGQRRLGRGRRR